MTKRTTRTRRTARKGKKARTTRRYARGGQFTNNLLPVQPLLYEPRLSVAVPAPANKVAFQMFIDVRRLVGRSAWFICNAANQYVINAPGWAPIPFDAVLARVQPYRAYQLLSTKLNLVSANNEGKIASAYLPGTGFPQAGQNPGHWNVTACNQKSLKIDTFAQGKTFRRQLNNIPDPDQYVQPQDVNQPYIKFAQTANFDVFAIECSWSLPLLE